MLSMTSMTTSFATDCHQDVRPVPPFSTFCQLIQKVRACNAYTVLKKSYHVYLQYIHAVAIIWAFLNIYINLFPPSPTKIQESPFIILLCLTLHDFAHRRRASRTERVEQLGNSPTGQIVKEQIVDDAQATGLLRMPVDKFKLL